MSFKSKNKSNNHDYETSEQTEDLNLFHISFDLLTTEDER